MGIAQALLGDPAFLIFDEPTVGLDPEERIHFRNLFSRLAQDRLVLLSTHIIEDVQSVCSRLLVLHQGRLRFDGTPEELFKQVEMMESVGLGVPQAAKLCAELRKRGVDLPDNLYTIDAVKEQLLRLWKEAPHA